jgi:chondroitin AC lyase
MKYTILTLIFSVFTLVASAQESPLASVRKAFVDASVVTYAPNEEITDRFIRYSDYGRANDLLLLQLYISVHLPDAEVERLLSLYDWEKRCWNDIDYSDPTRGRWPATLHVTRMYALAKLYKAGNEKWKDSAQLKTLLHSAMGWWYDNMPKCPNWWHNDIGVPKKFTAVLLMLRDELSQAEIDGGLKILERSKFGRTGQNKVALAGNNLMKGLLIDDEELVIKARDYIAEEMCMTETEGIQDDWSFHQHGPQIQFGNYGLAYAEGLSFWLRVLKGTAYDFTAGQKEIVSNMMKEGICWSVYGGVMDPSYCGRQNFIDAGPGKAYSLAVAAQNLSAAIDSEKDFYARVSRENLLPAEYQNTLTGARYYWRSDCGIYRTPKWYSSVRMHSDRTIGFEFTNKENTLANFSADGAVLLMQDAEEFENIFACWDWRKVPGVTAYDDGKPIKCDDSAQGKLNNSSHVGGLVSEDVMCATMELNRDGLYALKSSFFFEDCIVCLGAGIKGSNPEFKSITTAVDQIHLEGKVVAKDSWVWHAGRGYVALDGASMKVTTDLQKGKWDLIDPAFNDKWDECEVFKCWFEHPVDGSESSYAYAVVPDSSVSEVRKFAKASVLRNDKDCQAVKCGNAVAAVFHKAGEYMLDGDRYVVDVPSVMIKGGQSRLQPIVR